MVDVTLAPDVNSAQTNGDDGESYIHTGPLTAYKFYHDDTTPLLRYRKTIDGVLTWSAPVTVNIRPFVQRVAAWYDRHTSPTDVGSIIHLAYGTDIDVRYRQLNTATDALGSEVIVVAAGTLFDVQIVKLRNGDLLITWNEVLTRGMRRSTDGGSTWLAVDGLNPLEANGDHIRMLPASNSGDDADAWFLYWDADEISIKVFDASVPSITETSIALSMTRGSSGSRGNWGASIRHSDGFWVLAAWNTTLLGTSDLRFWTGNGAASIVEGGNVLTNTASFRAAVFIDQGTDDIYVVYCTAFGGGDIAYKVSRDGGTTWEAAVTFSASTGSMGQVQAGLMATANVLSKFAPAWFDDGPNDWETNFDNALLLGPFSPPALPPTPSQASGGSFNRLLSGGAGGFMTYITPDGRLIPLHTPHDFGRWTISFSGFGTPPIQYITQRGPFQHGETVKDFFLRPRVIQLLIRQGFANRTAWWVGRAALLDEIRPNRQATATAALPGQLRIVETDGTIRDLNVFISEGPRFEPRVSNQWDEHAFQEVLRFVAHDPVAFDPTQITATVTLSLASDLVFPITFPITFGSGLVDSTFNISYLGTWLELPVITIVGPLEDVRIDNTTTGEKIELSADIAPGRTLTIDLREGFKTVVDDLGTNLIGIVTSDSDLATFHLAPDPEAANGINAIRVRGTNPTGATSVSLAYFHRYFGF